MKQVKHLGDGELEIMQAVWDAGEPVGSGYVHQRLRGSRDWALPAVVTAMNRLVDKGFLSCEKQGRVNVYHQLISRETYQAAEGRSLLDRLYGGSFKGLAAALVDGDGVTREELRELRDYLDQLEGK